MKNSVFAKSLSLFAIAVFAGANASAQTIMNKRQLMLKEGDPVVVLLTNQVDVPAVLGSITEVMISEEGRVSYKVDGERVRGTQMFSIKPRTCLKGETQTLCVGDSVLENLLDSAPTEQKVVGIQVSPSGIFGTETHVLIQRGQEFVPQQIENLSLISSK